MKSLNNEIESVYKSQSQNLGELKQKLQDVEQYHSEVIDNDDEKLKAEVKLKELEKQF